MHRGFLICATFVALGGTSAHAGGGILPPVKVDMGKLAMSDRQGHFASGTSLLVGLNWATIYPKRTDIDVGIGYVGAFAESSENDGYLHVTAEGMLEQPEPQYLPSAHGAYVDLSMLAHEHWHVRTWVTGRAELLSSRGERVMGLATRVATELWSGIVVSGRGGGGFGVFAIGAWAEVGVRGLPGGGVVRQASMGLSARVPLIAAGH